MNNKNNKKKLPAIFNRRAKHGLTAIISIVAVLGILVLLNFIADRQAVRWDLTKTKSYSLSDQTVKVLEEINEQVDVRAFFSKSDANYEIAKDRLDHYSDLNRNIKVEFIDPDEKPSLAQQYNITRYETTVFTMGDRTEETIGTAESDFTSALLKLTKNERKKIYFLEGHNEKSIGEMTNESYSVLKEALDRENYEVAALNLLTDGKVPEDAAVVVMAGPRVSLLENEVNALKDYLNNNGKLLALIDPPSDLEADLNFGSLFSDWGIELKSGLLIDSENYFMTDPGSPVVQQWESHQITEGLPFVFFLRARGIAEKDVPENITIEALAKTSGKSWLETDLASEQVIFNEGQDEAGPLNIAVAVSEQVESSEEDKPTDGTRIVVIGDSDFASNIYSESLGNQDLLLNAINWLAQDEELISIRPKETEQVALNLTNAQIRYIFYTSVVAMPLVVIIIGIGVFVFRRKLKKKK